MTARPAPYTPAQRDAFITQLRSNPDIKRVEVIGGQTLILGDCLEVMPMLGRFDAVVTDPPYGLGKSWGKNAGWQGKCGKGRLWQGMPEWDEFTADLSHIPIDSPAIIWGGNYFDSLPPQKGWLVWDKEAATVQAQAELAWTNCAPTVRVFRDSPLGVFGNGGKNRELKQHPTQKPVSLMEWCLGFLPNATTILDPFAGSGSTGVACVNMGRSFTGIERDPDYFQIMCKRIDEACRAPRLALPEPQPQPVQEGFDL